MDRTKMRRIYRKHFVIQTKQHSVCTVRECDGVLLQKHSFEYFVRIEAQNKNQWNTAFKCLYEKGLSFVFQIICDVIGYFFKRWCLSHWQERFKYNTADFHNCTQVRQNIYDQLSSKSSNLTERKYFRSELQLAESVNAYSKASLDSAKKPKLCFNRLR